MLYTKIITVPYNTPKNKPVTDYLEIEEDTIVEIDILIPYGHRGVTGLRVLYGKNQIYPLPKGTWLVGDGIFIQHRLKYRLPGAYERITFEAYNESTRYPHSFYVYVHADWWENVDMETIMRKAFKPTTSLWRRLLEVLGIE